MGRFSFRRGTREIDRKASVIRLSSGTEITVPEGLGQLKSRIAAHLFPGRPPFMTVEDTDGHAYLLNLNDIEFVRATDQEISRHEGSPPTPTRG